MESSDVRMFETSPPPFLNFSIERILGPDFGPPNDKFHFAGKWPQTRPARRSFGESDFCALLRNIEGAASPPCCSGGEDSDDCRLHSSSPNYPRVFECPSHRRRRRTQNSDGILGDSRDGFECPTSRDIRKRETRLSYVNNTANNRGGDSADDTEGFQSPPHHKKSRRTQNNLQEISREEFDSTSPHSDDSRERPSSVKRLFVDNTARGDIGQADGDSVEDDKVFGLASRQEETKPSPNASFVDNASNNAFRRTCLRHSFGDVIPFGQNSISPPPLKTSSSCEPFQKHSNSKSLQSSSTYPTSFLNSLNPSISRHRLKSSRRVSSENDLQDSSPMGVASPSRSTDICGRSSLEHDRDSSNAVVSPLSRSTNACIRRINYEHQNGSDPLKVVKTQPDAEPSSDGDLQEGHPPTVVKPQSCRREQNSSNSKPIVGSSDIPTEGEDTKEKVPEKEEWPVWVYCSRYSARPSSGKDRHFWSLCHSPVQKTFIHLFQFPSPKLHLFLMEAAFLH